MMAVKNGEITPDLIEWLVADPEVGQKEVDNSFLITFKPKKKNSQNLLFSYCSQRETLFCTSGN